MAFRSFRLGIIFRVCILCLSLACLAYAVMKGQWVITSSCLLIVAIIEIIDLIRFTDKLNREISGFLKGIQFKDFARHFATGRQGKSFNELYAAFNNINEKYQSHLSKASFALFSD